MVLPSGIPCRITDKNVILVVRVCIRMIHVGHDLVSVVRRCCRRQRDCIACKHHVCLTRWWRSYSHSNNIQTCQNRQLIDGQFMVLGTSHMMASQMGNSCTCPKPSTINRYTRTTIVLKESYSTCIFFTNDKMIISYLIGCIY